MGRHEVALRCRLSGGVVIHYRVAGGKAGRLRAN